MNRVGRNEKEGKQYLWLHRLRIGVGHSGSWLDRARLLWPRRLSMVTTAEYSFPKRRGRRQIVIHRAYLDKS